MTAKETIVLTCAERDAAGIPVPPIAAALGYATWTEFATAMTTPNPLLMEMKWKPATEAKASAEKMVAEFTAKMDAAVQRLAVHFQTTLEVSVADAGRDTYRIEHPADPSPARLPGDHTGA